MLQLGNLIGIFELPMYNLEQIAAEKKEARAGEDKQTVDEFRASHPDLKIIVTGYISPKDLPAYDSLIDIFVHPSLRDGMPNAVPEAMACQIPSLRHPSVGYWMYWKMERMGL